MNDEQKRIEEAIAQHYAREQEGLPPPVPAFGGKYATFAEARNAHRAWLNEHFPLEKAPWPEKFPWVKSPAAAQDPPTE